MNLTNEKVVVCGAGGFIGNYIVKRLKREKFWVRAVDIKHHEFDLSEADEFIVADLRDSDACREMRWRGGSTSLAVVPCHRPASGTAVAKPELVCFTVDIARPSAHGRPS